MSARLRLFRVSQQLPRNFPSSCNCFPSLTRSIFLSLSLLQQRWLQLLDMPAPPLMKTTLTNILIYSRRGSKCSFHRAQTFLVKHK